MKRGEIWMADLNPAKGSEQDGYRPMVIISGDLLKDHMDIVIACPLTTKIKEYYGNLILKPNKENGLSEKSEVLTFQIRSISKSRLQKRLGKIPGNQLNSIIETLNDLLRY